jgi:hypothetical protein
LLEKESFFSRWTRRSQRNWNICSCPDEDREIDNLFAIVSDYVAILKIQKVIKFWIY